MARAHDELVGRLVRPGLHALCGFAPGRHRVTTAGGTAFTTTMGVIDRVHDDAAVVRALAHPALAAGLAQAHIAVVRVRNGANRCKAATRNEALFAGVETQDRHALITADELNVSAGRPSDLTALLGLHLDIVHNRANRHCRKRHRIARLHVDRLVAGDNLVAGSQTLRCQNVGQLAVLITNQRDERGAVRIVFDALDRCRHVKLATLEVDQTVGALVTAALKASGDATRVVAAALARQTLRQTLHGLALVKARAVNDDQLALAWGYRFILLKCHCLFLAARLEASRDVDGMTFSQRDDRFLHVALAANRSAKTLHLALANKRVDTGNLDAEERLDCSLDFRLRRLAVHIEDHLVVFRRHGRFLGDRRADDHVIVAKLRHLKRSSRASTAALERTSVPRRRMS
ncbi:NAD(FAD)-dependent dehydrogenase [Nitratireductor aquibiodomus RA22]|uniref:NAD(FAD)-dependent dehydrogenase n=1 Tax=Nitratireductor aquibiodomus RA22 TaxID=1189611 RepID=I5BUN0_9HYPH|nr:NAD(FAD)-dependent dehydrogenase [Nitratireductor aquibiodomus RA22]